MFFSCLIFQCNDQGNIRGWFLLAFLFSIYFIMTELPLVFWFVKLCNWSINKINFCFGITWHVIEAFTNFIIWKNNNIEIYCIVKDKKHYRCTEYLPSETLSHINDTPFNLGLWGSSAEQYCLVLSFHLLYNHTFTRI